MQEKRIPPNSCTYIKEEYAPNSRRSTKARESKTDNAISNRKDTLKDFSVMTPPGNHLLLFNQTIFLSAVWFVERYSAHRTRFLLEQVKSGKQV